MSFLVYCDTDDKGNIYDGISGVNIIPQKQYQYFFYLDNEIDLMNYKVENHELKPKNEDNGAE